MAYLPRGNLDRGAGIQSPAQAWTEGLISDAAVAGGHLPDAGRLTGRGLERLHAAAQGPTDKERL